MKEIATPSTTKYILEKYHLNALKKYGQNFLIDVNIINKIVTSAKIDQTTAVIEVGPGIGALTQVLGRYSGKVTSFEIDERFMPVYQEFLNQDNIEIIFGDFMEQDIKPIVDQLKQRYQKVCLVANLPYYITTPIITKVIESDLDVSKMVIMVQKEVGDRFSSKPGNKEYGSITVFLNYYFNIKKLFDVSRNCFYPKPNVDSVILMLEKKNDTYNVKDREKLFKLIRDSFSFKRKTIKNNLKGYDLNKVEEVLINNGYSLSSRAEELPLDVFIQIANEI